MLNLHLKASMGYGRGISAFTGISSSHPTRRGMIWELVRRSIAYIHRLCSIRIGTFASPGADSPCNECQTFIRTSSFLRSLSVVVKVISKPGGDGAGT
jgi:hypothetical protein